MDDLRELYQEMILDHGRTPRNFGRPEGCNREAHGDNPLCGDKIDVYVTLRDGVVEDVGFEGSGCAISTASASIMTEMLKGRTAEEVRKLFAGFRDLVMGKEAVDGGLPPEDKDRLMVLSGVRQFPMRVKCATLAWHTINAALKSPGKIVSTESGELAT